MIFTPDDFTRITRVVLSAPQMDIQLVGLNDYSAILIFARMISGGIAIYPSIRFNGDAGLVGQTPGQANYAWCGLHMTRTPPALPNISTDYGASGAADPWNEYEIPIAAGYGGVEAFTESEVFFYTEANAGGGHVVRAKGTEYQAAGPEIHDYVGSYKNPGVAISTATITGLWNQFAAGSVFDVFGIKK